MKKLKSNITRRIKNIDLQIANLTTEYHICGNGLQHMYGISDEHFDYDYNKWTDSDFEYAETHAQLFHDYDFHVSKLNAKKAAAMLIGYNIARRGKRLHESTVLRKTARLGADGEFIRNQMACIYNHTILAFPLLQMELNKYGVNLLDYNQYGMIINRIEHLAQSDISWTTKEHRLNRYAAQLKLFNAQIRNRYEQRHKTK